MLHPGGRPAFSNTNFFLYLCFRKKYYKVMYLVISVGLNSFDKKGRPYNSNFVFLFHFNLKRTQNPHPLIFQQQTRGRFENGGWAF